MLNSGQGDADNSELNFTAFTDLCRFCSLRIGPKINLFEKEAEQRQILYKIRLFVPIVVGRRFVPHFLMRLIYVCYSSEFRCHFCAL